MSSSKVLLAVVVLSAVTASLVAQPACELTQVTETMTGYNINASLDGSMIAFESTADPLGSNGDGNPEIFLWDGLALTQITKTTTGYNSFPSLSDGSIAFESTADFLGTNGDGNLEIFLWDGQEFAQVASAHSSIGPGSRFFA